MPSPHVAVAHLLVNMLKTEQLPNTHHLSYTPLPGSRKIYKNGSLHKDLRVPFREVALSPTKGPNNSVEENAPVVLYDTSGPYTDAAVSVDITQGLPELRQNWILDRGDVYELEEPTSHYRKEREADINLLPSGRVVRRNSCAMKWPAAARSFRPTLITRKLNP